MAFLEQRISDAITRGSRGGPKGKRLKSYARGGQLEQHFVYEEPLHEYDASYGIKTQEDFEEIRACFYVVMFTPYEGFLWRDWNDYRATQANSVLAFIEGSTWQLKRRYTFGGIHFDRTIAKPDADGLTVWRTRSGVVSEASATVDATTGFATISGHAGGDTYTWEGTFNVPVTFVDDAIENVELEGHAGFEMQGLPSIKLEEIRL